MKINKLLAMLGLISISVISTNTFAKDGKLKVAFITGPELTVGQVARDIAKQKFNLDVEIVEFTDYVTPNMALIDEDIDANAFQHLPYLKSQSKDRGWNNLVVVGKTFTFPLLGYSNKFTKIEEIHNGANIGIPNDPSNQGRALLLLQKTGLIKLKDPTSLTQSVLDIIENPHNLNVQSLDAALLVPALGELDLAIINNTFAAKAKLDPKKSLIQEGSDSPYVNLIVARENNKNDPDLINFVKAFQSEEVFQKAQQEFDNIVVKGW